MDQRILHDAQEIWGYMLLGQPVENAEAMIILGSRDDRVAAYATQLSGQYGFSSIVVTGGLSHTQDLLATAWGDQTEAEHFADVFKRNNGNGNILEERNATNTGQNAQYSHELLLAKGVRPESLLIVTKPYMERRALATFQAQWPDRDAAIRVTSVGGQLGSYCNNDQPFDMVVNIMVGDLERIIRYPALGMQVRQDVPERVMAAWKRLIAAGYTEHLVN